jgi:hypothetical protein
VHALTGESEIPSRGHMPLTTCARKPKGLGTSGVRLIAQTKLPQSRYKAWEPRTASLGQTRSITSMPPTKFPIWYGQVQLPVSPARLDLTSVDWNIERWARRKKWPSRDGFREITFRFWIHSWTVYELSRCFHRLLFSNLLQASHFSK